MVTSGALAMMAAVMNGYGRAEASKRLPEMLKLLHRIVQPIPPMLSAHVFVYQKESHIYINDILYVYI